MFRNAYKQGDTGALINKTPHLSTKTAVFTLHLLTGLGFSIYLLSTNKLLTKKTTKT
jgi:hypothetical protein